MDMQTISQVSKEYGVSLRMLRYYEQEGILESVRKAGYAYRVYSEAAIHRLRQIIILRKLRIPVKQIKAIFDNHDATAAIEIFQKNIGELDEEITALSTIKAILKQFVDVLQEKANINLHLDMLTDSSMLPLLDSLSFTKHQLKESLTMDALNKAAGVLNKLRNVRVVFLPPMTVAAICAKGENRYESAWQEAVNFVKQNNLLDVKPDLRVFRFDYMNATGHDYGGHEVWVSIPDNMDVPLPFIRKRFYGGQYAVHAMGDDGFHTALGLQDWINESEKYQADYEGNLLRCNPPIEELDAFGGMWLDLHEVLNFYNDQSFPTYERIDICLPIINYEIAKEQAPIEIPGSKEKCGFKASIMSKNKFKLMGFTKIMTGESTNPESFEAELVSDGRLELLHIHKKPGAPILGFGSHDMDSQIRGGWRFTVCLMESDIMDVKAFMEHNPYVETIDASRWLIFEHTREDSFDGHSVCMKLGYTWNGCISGSITVYPDGKIGKPVPKDEDKETVYCWYPVKYEKETIKCLNKKTETSKVSSMKP